MRTRLNPYAPGSGANPPLLAGRDDELRAFADTVERLRSGLPARGPVLLGLRGVGKTVLLNRIRDVSLDADWLTIDVEGQHTRSGGACIRRQIAHGLVLASRTLHRTGAVSESVRRALGTVRSFGLSFGGISIDLGVDATPGRADTGTLEIDLQEAVEDLVPALRERGIALAVVIDEIQDVDEELLATLLTVQHRAAQRSWPFIIVAAGLPNAPAVLASARSYAGRMFEFHRIGALTRAAAEMALDGPATDAGVRWDPDALDTVLTASDGFPFHLQTFASAAWTIALDGDRVTDDDARAGVERGRAELDAGFFPGWWDRTTDRERRCLDAVARSAGATSVDALAEELGGSRDRTAAVCRALVTKGVLYRPARGTVAFTVPQMDDFVRRQRGLDSAD
jgi:hypothetical protein